ncbi:hypothetical protein KZ829_19350 [Actinoplanes hulinensis]|uniref:PLL-like beta propeller domain-containing protein n=1 Tax=Actinoplanes hulinensis TaxID=1144547 RepID=A0ABS7B4D7_9ACTN|nr:hypothetical protein [Actinoplanes hulinensis]MBW6435901.1 hypothetical protein [Actinoplanes hulinensis]
MLKLGRALTYTLTGVTAATVIGIVPAPAVAAAAPLPSDVTALSTPAADPFGRFIVSRGLDGTMLYSRGNPTANTYDPFVSTGQVILGDPTGVLTPDGAQVFGRDVFNRPVTALGAAFNQPSGFEVIPGLLISSEIAAVQIPSRGSQPPQTRIFARGLEDGAVYTNLLIQGSPQGWVNLGGVITSEIAAAVTGPLDFTVNLRLVARGTDNRLYSMLFNNTNGVVSGWTPVGDLVATGNPELLSNGGTQELRGNELFVRGAPRNGVFTWNFDSPGWVDLGGVANSDLTAAVASDGGVQFWVRGTTNNIYLNRRAPGAVRFGGYINLRGIGTGNPVSTGAAPFAGRTVADQVFVRGTDNRLYGLIQVNFVGGFDRFAPINGPAQG